MALMGDGRFKNLILEVNRELSKYEEDTSSNRYDNDEYFLYRIIRELDKRITALEAAEKVREEK